MENIIEINNIVKEFKHKKGIVRALDNISFNVKKGEIFGFLGENGAGKSTLISILTSFSIPSSGEASISGHNVVKHGLKARKEFGIVFQGESVDQDLSVEYNL
jgi:ABC-2 type transport system ATP-binding protein